MRSTFSKGRGRGTIADRLSTTSTTMIRLGTGNRSYDWRRIRNVKYRKIKKSRSGRCILYYCVLLVRPMYHSLCRTVPLGKGEHESASAFLPQLVLCVPKEKG